MVGREEGGKNKEGEREFEEVHTFEERGLKWKGMRVKVKMWEEVGVK